MDTLIRQLVRGHRLASPDQLRQIIEQVADAPFASGVLEVDKALWGSFWHFDVISPGYLIPAVELALLRAIRLDRYWPEETGVEHFLSDLRQAILHPDAGLWTAPLAGEPCLAIAAPAEMDEPVTLKYVHQTDQPRSGPTQVGLRPELVTIVWYCTYTGQLHAGYRAQAVAFKLEGAVEQRPPHYVSPRSTVRVGVENWLAPTVEHRALLNDESFAGQLDLEILRLRLAAGSTAPVSPP